MHLLDQDQNLEQDSTPEESIARVCAKLRDAGAKIFDAVVCTSRHAECNVRYGKVEKLEDAESIDVGMRVLIGQRQAFVACSSLDPDILAQSARRCVDMASVAPVDPYAGLLGAADLAETPDANRLAALELGDFSPPDHARLEELASACEETALQAPKIVNSYGGAAAYGEASFHLGTSNGFTGGYKSCFHQLSAAVIAGENGQMERDYHGACHAYAQDLPDAGEIGATAAKRARARLGACKPATKRMHVYFDRRVSASLLGRLAGAITGAAITQKNSFLPDALDTQVFSSGITITDDPHLPRGHATCPFDGEGRRNAKKNIIEDGVLTGWLLNSAHARRMGLAPSGHATRPIGAPPGEGVTNFYLNPGTMTPVELWQNFGDGVLITELFGPQVNTHSGDYSAGCFGFHIEKGEITRPLHEMTISGNLREMFKQLMPADDLLFDNAINAPSLYAGQMSISGQ